MTRRAVSPLETRSGTQQIVSLPVRASRDVGAMQAEPPATKAYLPLIIWWRQSHPPSQQIIAEGLQPSTVRVVLSSYQMTHSTSTDCRAV